MPLRIIKVRLRIVTPLFMGGANQEAAEWRPPSIKGLLRYWYRACHYAEKGQSPGEARIFGGTDEGEGQGLFLLHSVRPPAGQVPGTDVEKLFGRPGQPLSYLGYGIVQRNKSARGQGSVERNVTARGALLGDAELVFRFRPASTDADIEAVLGSLWLLCHVGGMGSRSRRGLGSVTWLDSEMVQAGADGLQGGAEVREQGVGTNQGGATSGPAAPDPWEWPRQAANVEQLEQDIRSVLARLCPQPPGQGTVYTAFCKGTRILIGSPASTWETALQAVGQALQNHRTYRHQPPGYPEDHDLVYTFAHTGRAAAAPRRTVFGLPHNYFFSHDKMSVSVDPVGGNGNVNRRASPLFIHIGQLAGPPESYVPVVTFIPARFLPKGVQIRLESRDPSGGRHLSHTATVPAPAAPDEPGGYGPIHAFLDQFKRATHAREVTL